MPPELSRRAFLGTTAVVGASALVVPRLAGTRSSTAPQAALASMAEDDLTALIALSRDATGRAHIVRAAFVDGDEVRGNLPVRPDELAALTCAFASRDVRAFEAYGLHMADAHCIVIGHDADDDALHAIGQGEFVTVRAFPGGMIIATSDTDMAHGRAVEAVYQFTAKRRALAPDVRAET